MKKLWIVRHAKSSWSDFALPDHDRPLNSRGNRDAPFMSKHVAENYPTPTHLVSSTAKRAQATCKAFRKALDLDKDAVERTSDLYHASLSDCLAVIQRISDEVEIAAIFGHNPTFTYLVEELTGDGPSNLPTCGCVLVTSQSDSWSSFGDSECHIEVFLYPKQFNLE